VKLPNWCKWAKARMNEFRRRTDSVLPSVERRQKAHAINLTIFTGFCMEENYSTFRKLGQYYAMQISCTTVKHLKEYYKFRANMCNSKRVMSDRWNSKWQQPPSWIYYFCSFWSNGLFPVAAAYITAKFHSSTSIRGRVIAVFAKIQNSGHRHLGFNFCLIFWHTCM